MGKQAQIKQSRKIAGDFVPIFGAVTGKVLSAEEWRKDLLVSWLFQTCIRLQTSLDRRFLRFGMSVQEANVLLHCVEARKITPGQLAVVLGRDKGKITRFVDRLETSRLVTRDIDRRDKRISVIKPTGRGKQIARDLACVFDNIRNELFAGIPESDVRRLGQMLPRLNKNAVRIGSRRHKSQVRGRSRIGRHRVKSQGWETGQAQAPANILTPSPNGLPANTLGLEQEGRESGLIPLPPCQ
jgi:MarR family transcriptional regulator, transcriptional regulator for hemolysin